MQKQLCRSTTNTIVGGVCGGLGEYFDVDPTLVRIISVLLFFATGFGVLAYIVGWIIMPKPEESAEVCEAGEVPAEKRQYGSWNKYLPGFILIAIGIVLLLRENVPWFDWGELWPVLLIMVGLLLIFRRKARTDQDPMTVNGEHHGTSQNGDSLS